MDGKLFYIQKTGMFCGNSPLWWKKGGNGYSPDLKEAELFWEEEAKRICSKPGSDKQMWPQTYIANHIEHHVDTQNLNHDKAMAESDS